MRDNDMDTSQQQRHYQPGTSINTAVCGKLPPHHGTEPMKQPMQTHPRGSQPMRMQPSREDGT